jgi:hypothetical protein
MKTIIILAMLFLSPLGVFAQDITLSWDLPNLRADLVGYNIYKDGELHVATTTPEIGTKTFSSVGLAMYDVTAYDTDGNESFLANTVYVYTDSYNTVTSIIELSGDLYFLSGTMIISTGDVIIE